jgi:hypothetical protein
MYEEFKAKKKRREERERPKRLVYIHKGAPRETLLETGSGRFKG